MGNRATLNPENIRVFVQKAVDYVGAVAARKNLVISRVAIDAPSSFCNPKLRRSAAESAMDRAGISCFATPSEANFEVIKRKAADHITRVLPDNRIPHSNFAS